MLYKNMSDIMDFDAWLEGASKWILPLLGLIWVLQKLLGLSFSFGFNF